MQVGHAIIAEPVTISSPRYAKDLRVPGAVVMTWLNAVQYLNGSGVNQRGKYKSAYLKDVTTSYAHGLYEVLAAPSRKLLKGDLAAAGLKIPEGFDTTSLIVQMDSYGGSINRRADEGDAIWQRGSHLKVQYQVYWHDPAQDELYLHWMRKVYEAGFARQGHGGGRPWDPEAEHCQGCYVNYPDVDMLTGEFGGRGEPRSWLDLYFGPVLPRRLVAAKSAYDPFDVFRHAMSIPTVEPRP
jgi:hypothetical protein